MITLTPVELLLRVSAATVGACEVGPNAGPYVERVLKRTGNTKGDPWCASWFTDVGMHALGQEWPCKRSASVAAICAWAEHEGCSIAPGEDAASPQIGDGFALWFESLKRWAHIGIVIGVNTDGTVNTREGNTNASGGREGWLVAEKTRKLTSMDRLIRWQSLIP